MSAFEEQIGGSHYKGLTVSTARFCEKNHLSCLESSVVKHVTRHRLPTGGGREDLEKAIHELRMLLELTYGVVVGQSDDD